MERRIQPISQALAHLPAGLLSLVRNHAVSMLLIFLVSAAIALQSGLVRQSRVG